MFAERINSRMVGNTEVILSPVTGHVPYQDFEFPVYGVDQDLGKRIRYRTPIHCVQPFFAFKCIVVIWSVALKGLLLKDRVMCVLLANLH